MFIIRFSFSSFQDYSRVGYDSYCGGLAYRYALERMGGKN